MKIRNKKNKLWSSLLFCMMSTSSVYADEIYDLTHVINTTLKQAPEILQQQAVVEGTEAAIKLQTGAFDHRVTASYGAQLKDSPVISYNQPLYLNLPNVQSYQNLLQAGMTEQFRNGISAGINVNVFHKQPLNGLIEANALGTPLTTSNETQINFQVNIPLLKGATRVSAAAAENAAILEYQATQNDFSYLISSIILNAVNAYWTFKVAEESLAINRQSQERVEKWTDEAEQRFIKKDPAHTKEMQAKYRGEIYSIQAYLATKHLTVISSTQALEEARIGLAVAMGTPYKNFDHVKASSEQFPEFAPIKLSPAQLAKDWVLQAEDNRADLKAIRLRQEGSDVLVRKFTRDLLPQVDVGLGAGYQGLSEGTSAAAFGSALYRNVPGPNLSGQVTFAYPLENNVQEGLLSKQQATSRFIMIEMGNLGRKINAKIDVDMSLLNKNMAQKAIAEKAVAFYQPAVDTLVERAMKEAPGILDLLQFEDRLVDSKINLLQVKGKLAGLVAKVRFDTGTLISSNDENHAIDIKGLSKF